MSLDVSIIYKHPKKVNYNKTHSACGSVMAVVDDDYESTETEWWANITHNMVEMADHIPVTYTDKSGIKIDTTLYQMVWRPEEVDASNTNQIGEALESGLVYMVTHRSELLQYNPENGWGSYDSFLNWLIKYKQACDENPNCEVEASR